MEQFVEEQFVEVLLVAEQPFEWAVAAEVEVEQQAVGATHVEVLVEVLADDALVAGIAEAADAGDVGNAGSA